MTKKMPDSAFEFYVGLGPSRSYQAVADEFGVTKRAVTKRATAERWAARLAAMERESRERMAKRAEETLDEMNERHLRIAKALQAKAVDALRNAPLETTRDVIKALELGVKQERLVRGEPTDRNAIEEITKRELRDLLTFEDADEPDGDAA
jgi:hypothetical protein